MTYDYRLLNTSDDIGDTSKSESHIHTYVRK